MKPHILLIDDSETVQAAVSDVLADSNYWLTTASSAAEGLSCVERHKYQLVLLDYSLPDADGLSLLTTLAKEQPDIPLIMVTGSGSERVAVEALKSGASDYVVKTNDFVSKLPHVVKDNLEKYEMRRRNRELESQLRESYKQLKLLNQELEGKVETRTEELERAYQLSNELMAKAVDSNMQLAELYSEVDESRRKLDAKIRELSLLNEVGKTMASTLDRDTLLQVTLDSVHQELGVEHCAILLLDADVQGLQIGISRGTPDDLLLASHSLQGRDVLMNVIHDNGPLLIQDVEAHEQFRALAHDFPGLECFMLVPLRVKNLEIGILTLYGYESGATFTQSNLEFVSALASQASIALANIILTNQRIQEEQIGMIGKLTNYVMHDLKNSFKTIRDHTERIDGDDLDPEQRKTARQLIVSEIDRITAMTQELLEFSHGQQGTLNLETVSVEHFIQDVLTNFEQKFAGRQLTLRTELGYTDSLSIDVAKMKHVFLHLVENAAHAMGPKGTLTITSRLVNETTEFEIRDTGHGIRPELQARIFEPFVSSGTAHGTGLGLTIVKKILNEHHARIEVQSVVDKGTTVRIMLPRFQQS
jgi:signal transduction histidine kinase/DNA-binding response OmpR family regulator